MQSVVKVEENVTEEIKAVPDVVNDHLQHENVREDDQIPIVGHNIYARFSRVAQSLFRLLGNAISLGFVDPVSQDSIRSRCSKMIRAATVRTIACFLFAYTLFFLYTPRYIWITPLFYDAIHTCFIILESFNKSRRFCHRNVCLLFDYHVREMHDHTMLWVRPLVSTYFALISSCLLCTLTTTQQFEGILIRMFAYKSFWFGIVWHIFHLTAHSDPHLLNNVLPDQRTTAEMYNLDTISPRAPDGRLLDVLQTRENYIWQDSLESDAKLPKQSAQTISTTE